MNLKSIVKLIRMKGWGLENVVISGLDAPFQGRTKNYANDPISAI